MVARRHKPLSYRALAVSLGISAIMLGGWLIFSESVDPVFLGRKLIVPLFRLMLFITIGLAVGQIIESVGWTRFLAVLARPFFHFSRLGLHCGAAFTTAFFSGVAANAMLVDFYKDGKISRGQLFLTNLINQLPAYFLHLPTTIFIVIPLTGVAGGLYFLLTFLAVLLRTFFVLLYGYVRLPPLSRFSGIGPEKDNGQPFTKKNENVAARVWLNVKQKLPRRVVSIVVYMIPVYIAVFILNAMGFFDITRQWLAGVVVTTFIPIEALSVIVLSFAAEFTSGFAAAGAMLDAGVLTTKQTALALLIGNIVAFPMRALRHQLPRYIGIFAPKMGTQLLLLGQGYRVVSLILVGVIYYAFC